MSSTRLFHFFSAISNKSFVRETRLRSYLEGENGRERKMDRSVKGEEGEGDGKGRRDCVSTTR